MTKQEEKNLSAEQAEFLKAVKEYVNKKTHPPSWYMPIILSVTISILGFFVNEFYQDRKTIDNEMRTEIQNLDKKLEVISVQLSTILSTQQAENRIRDNILTRVNATEDNIIELRQKVYELQRLHGIAR